jgi:hypothetical protein
MPSDPRNDRSRFNLRVLDGGRAGGAAEPVREPRRRVIVVDDEELSRALFVSVLGKLGSPLIEVSAFAAPEPALACDVTPVSHPAITRVLG